MTEEGEIETMHADFYLLIARAEDVANKRKDSGWLKLWYRFALDYLDTFLDDESFDEHDCAHMAYDLYSSFMSHCGDGILGKRLFAHCSRGISDGFEYVEYTYEEIISLGKYSEDSRWAINYFLGQANFCGDYDGIFNIAIALRHIGAVDEANSLLSELLEMQDDPAVTSNLAVRLKEENWPEEASLKIFKQA